MGPKDAQPIAYYSEADAANKKKYLKPESRWRHDKEFKRGQELPEYAAPFQCLKITEGITIKQIGTFAFEDMQKYFEMAIHYKHIEFEELTKSLDSNNLMVKGAVNNRIQAAETAINGLQLTLNKWSKVNQAALKANLNAAAGGEEGKDDPTLEQIEKVLKYLQMLPEDPHTGEDEE